MQTYEEVWKDIPNYEGCYQVSNLGRVRSLARIVSDGSPRKGRILKGGMTNGYRRIVLCGKDSLQKAFYIHRLLMLAFFGESSLDVNHKNGIKTDNRIENLEYCTRKENINHAYKIGLKKSKLTESEAIEIKYENKCLTLREIASRYGVSQSRISEIRREKTWKHI